MVNSKESQQDKAHDHTQEQNCHISNNRAGWTSQREVRVWSRLACVQERLSNVNKHIWSNLSKIVLYRQGLTYNISNTSPIGHDLHDFHYRPTRFQLQSITPLYALEKFRHFSPEQLPGKRKSRGLQAKNNWPLQMSEIATYITSSGEDNHHLRYVSTKPSIHSI